MGCSPTCTSEPQPLPVRQFTGQDRLNALRQPDDSAAMRVVERGAIGRPADGRKPHPPPVHGGPPAEAQCEHETRLLNKWRRHSSRLSGSWSLSAALMGLLAPFLGERNGISARTDVPKPGLDTTLNWPPIISTRSRMPDNPRRFRHSLVASRATLNDLPLSATSRETLFPES